MLEALLTYEQRCTVTVIVVDVSAPAGRVVPGKKVKVVGSAEFGRPWLGCGSFAPGSRSMSSSATWVYCGRGRGSLERACPWSI